MSNDDKTLIQDDNPKQEKTPAPESKPAYTPPAAKKDSSSAGVGVGVGVAAAGAGVAMGAIFSDEIKEGYQHLENAVSDAASGLTDAVSPSSDSMMTHSVTDDDGSVHTVELIDCDGDGVVDDMLLTTIDPNGEYVTTGGSLDPLNQFAAGDGGFIDFDPPPFIDPFPEGTDEVQTIHPYEPMGTGFGGGEIQQGLTYTVQLHDFDMDGVIDDGSFTMVGPEDEFVIEHIFEDDMGEFSNLDMNFAEEDSYGEYLGLSSLDPNTTGDIYNTDYEEIEWDSFSDASVESDYMMEFSETDFEAYVETDNFEMDSTDYGLDMMI
jgi:hypothetical protein